MRPAPACLAPSAQLFFRPNGDVRVCCRNETALGNITRDTLAEIWASTTRHQIRDHVARHDYSYGCQHCGSEVETEGREGSYPEQFDSLASASASGSADEGFAWPRIMDFTLSITCNLQCVQCNGDSSSAIRTQREGRRPMPQAYGDSFFEDLRPFLRHLDSASFSGGEPFLAAENYRVWEMIAEEAPGLPVTVVTNATQYTPRVESILDRVPMSFRFSIDAATAETYEAIRIGADHASVMANVERYLEHCKSHGTSAAVNHCLMVQNAHEFPDLLRWADGLGLPVHVSVVRDDARTVREGPGFAIVRQTPEAVGEIHRMLEARSSEMEAELTLNLATWRDEVDRLRRWSRCEPEELRALWGVSGHTVLMFPCQGAGPADGEDARADLADWAPDGAVHQITWGRAETITEVSSSLDDLLDGAADRLVGQSPDGLLDLLQAHLGTLTDYRVVDEGPDRVDATATFVETEARIAMAPQRDANGWADTAVQLFAFAPRTDP